MTPQEINDKNEKIARFMGIESFENNGDTWWRFTGSEFDHYALKGDDLHYNASWDWLMPVVEKISITALVDIKIHKSGGCSFWVDGTLISGAYNGTTIEQVYSCVHRFIDWYNENEVKG